MHAHCPFRDREADAGATATLSIARILGSIKRTKDLFERLFRYTLTSVSDAYYGTSVLSTKRDLNRRPLWRVTNRIAHDIFNRTAKQFLNAVYRTLFTRNYLHRTIRAARFEITIFSDFTHERRKIHIRSLPTICAAFESR